MNRMSPRERARLRAAVLRAARRLLAAGIGPTEHHLATRLPGRGKYTLVELRDELVAEGLLDWCPPEPRGRQLDYVPDAAELRERARLVRLGLPLPEETARGGPGG